MTDIPSIDLTGKAVDQAALDRLTSIGEPRRLVGAVRQMRPSSSISRSPDSTAQ